MDRIRDWLEKHFVPNGVSYYFIPSCYTFGGLILFIAIPSYIFTIMEGKKTLIDHANRCFPDWTMLDAVYYSFISLSTIGFGDFIPSMEPPDKYATYVRNDTA